MKSNTHDTKKRLMFVFSLIVFLTVSILSLFYYTGTYYWYQNEQYEKFSGFVDSIERLNVIDAENILLSEKKMDDWGMNVGYVILENGIIDSYTPFVIDANKIQKIQELGTQDIYTVDSFFIRKININPSKTIVFFMKNFYTISNCINDIAILFLISFLASLMVYAFSKKFIEKIFIPVENNIVSMNEFVHNAGHELQTPLSVIISNIDFYRKSREKDDAILLEIKTEAKKMGELIKTLLRLSREDYSINTEEFNLSVFIHEILGLFLEKIRDKKIVVSVSMDEELMLNTNKEHLFICITNIISNAIKYNIENGFIRIAFSRGKIVVEDSGVGIDSENIHRIFDRFYKEDSTRGSEGFGVGLSLVKKLCDINHWNIDVSSKKNKGTIVTLNTQNSV